MIKKKLFSVPKLPAHPPIIIMKGNLKRRFWALLLIFFILFSSDKLYKCITKARKLILFSENSSKICYEFSCTTEHWVQKRTDEKF